MARGVNRVILIGNACADPEVKYSATGGAITNVTVACNDSYKDKKTGQMVDNTEFVRVVFFNRLAEIVGEYMRKGSKVYIEGRMKTRKWQGQDGQDRYTTEVVANEMQLLDSRGDNASQGAQQPQGRPQQPQGQPQQNAYPSQGHAPPQQGYPQQGGTQYDQGIPDDAINF